MPGMGSRGFLSNHGRVLPRAQDGQPSGGLARLDLIGDPSVNSVAAANPGLHVSARTENRVTIAELTGELDIASAPDLRERLLALLRPSSGRLVIDLSRVSFCDASGLAVLIGTGRRARLLGGFLRLAAVPPEVSRVLRSTGLDQHLVVFPTTGLAASAPSTPSSGTGAATQTARPARPGPALPVKPAQLGRPGRPSGSSTELRNAVTAVLSHVQAWHDADPDRRFTPALQAMARARAGTDALTLDTAARSLLLMLSRHPLTYSPAVAETATRLRRVLGPDIRSAVG